MMLRVLPTVLKVIRSMPVYYGIARIPQDFPEKKAAMIDGCRSAL
jgi:hypothetical protein